MNSDAPVPARRRKLGCFLMSMGLLLGVGFWWVVIVVRSSAPDYDPHRSPAGFWSDVQTTLKVSWWRHADGTAVGVFGGKEWVEKIMATVAAGKAFEGCEGGHRDSALSIITNHDFSSASNVREAWLEWWQENQSKTQEEWIQEGFKLHGFDINLPPTPQDRPQLLSILGATAGPDPRYTRKPEMLYPDQVRYNAYRWLRDSGFDPVHHTVVEAQSGMITEQSGGLVEYDDFEKSMNSPPPPGRMAFAHDLDWGYLGANSHFRRPGALRSGNQILFTLISLVLLWAGWKLVRPKLHATASTQRTKRQIVGWLMILTSGSIGIAFWTLIVPICRGRAPEFSPQLSAAGFWETKQIHLNLGWWWHEDGNVVGLFGGKEWAAKIMHWMATGKDIESCAAGHRNEALPFLTNHIESDAADPKQAWLNWWSANASKTQEQWIQEGFRRYGFEIALPPTEKDWRALLQILGSSPGPAAAYPGGEPRPQSYLYPYALCYNAYRWLRDSGFEPVLYVLTNGSTLTGEETSGLLRYRMQKNDLALFEAPLPGRLSFAPEPKTDYYGMSVFYGPPRALQPKFQLQVAATLMTLGGLGLWLAHPRKTG